MPAEIERAVVQVMTYLVENEQAALIIPARLLGQLHPHFREVMQLLATQAADEARHVEVFTRRGLLSGGPLGTSGAGGRASLQTLLDEPDFTTASFLLSVLGEGTFLDLLRFLHEHAPDPGHRGRRPGSRCATRRGTWRSAWRTPRTSLAADQAYLGALRQSVERRHAALLDTAGLNSEVFDALVLLAAGSWEPDAISRGWQAVRGLQQRWTRAAAAGSPTSASPTTRRPSCPPCTPATSCDRRPTRRDLAALAALGMADYSVGPRSWTRAAGCQRTGVVLIDSAWSRPRELLGGTLIKARVTRAQDLAPSRGISPAKGESGRGDRGPDSDRCSAT